MGLTGACWLRFKPKGEVKNTQASISDFDAILPAFEGIDTVVHMSHDADYEALDMSGTHNVLEACRQCGVKRIIYGSSGDTMVGYGTRSASLCDPP